MRRIRRVFHPASVSLSAVTSTWNISPGARLPTGDMRGGRSGEPFFRVLFSKHLLNVSSVGSFAPASRSADREQCLVRIELVDDDELSCFPDVRSLDELICPSCLCQLSFFTRRPEIFRHPVNVFNVDAMM
jgi:hypothetical protein